MIADHRDADWMLVTRCKLTCLGKITVTEHVCHDRRDVNAPRGQHLHRLLKHWHRIYVATDMSGDIAEILCQIRITDLHVTVVRVPILVR